MIRLPKINLNSICIGAVIFAVGAASGVLLERAIGSPDVVPADTEATAEADGETAAEDAILAELNESDAQPQKESESQPQAPKVEEPKPAPATNVQPIGKYESLSEAEKADIKYLKENDAWASSKVRSPRFKNMFTQLNSGNIDAIITAFSGLEKDYVNGYAKKVISAIPKLSSDGREKAKKFLCEEKGETIKLSWAAKKIGEMAK